MEKNIRLAANQKAVMNTNKEKASGLKEKFKKMEDQVARNNQNRMIY
jgi:hypothetical protein